MSYRTVIVDPPWDQERGGEYAWREGQPSGEKAARQLDYAPMSVEQIAAIDIPSVLAEDAVLFLWTTQAYLEASFAVLRAWGVERSCTLSWVKAPRGWGPGGVFQSNVEFVHYARRGRGARPDGREQIRGQWWEWPRGQHSAKPEAFMDMVEEEFEGPRLEVFQRRSRMGWSGAGDQSIGDVEIAGMRS